MARTITAYLYESEQNFSYANGVYTGLPLRDGSRNQIQLLATEVPVKVTISGHIERVATVNADDYLFLSSSAVNTATQNASYHLLTFWLLCQADGGTLLKHSDAWNSFLGAGLQGQYLYLWDGNPGDIARHTGNWEVIITTVDIPNVTAGDKITKTQWDTLKSYRERAGNTPTAATKGSVISASVANTYGKTTVSAGESMSASWYNT